MLEAQGSYSGCHRLNPQCGRRQSCIIFVNPGDGGNPYSLESHWTAPVTYFGTTYYGGPSGAGVVFRSHEVSYHDRARVFTQSVNVWAICNFYGNRQVVQRHTWVGTVTFKHGITMLGIGTLTGGVAKYTTRTLAVGVDSITAVYGGSTSLAASTSTTLKQVVNKATTTTTLLSSLNPSGRFGQSVTLYGNGQAGIQCYAHGNGDIFKNGTCDSEESAPSLAAWPSTRREPWPSVRIR